MMLLLRLGPLISIALTLVFSPSRAEIRFIENKGQWNKGDYCVPLNGGYLFFRNGSMVWVNRPTLHELKDQAAKGIESFKTEHIFLTMAGAQALPQRQAYLPFKTLYNYHRKGVDGKIKSISTQAFNRVEYLGIYPGIDMAWYENHGTLEYDFDLDAGADPTLISLEVAGGQVEITEGRALISGTLGHFTMEKPIAFQVIGGITKNIQCSYNLQKGRIGFRLGQYDDNYPLTIDPRLTFSTLSGSRADNWGTTATFDKEANAYGGGIVFSSGFPVTAGVVDQSFNGIVTDNNVDIGIQKFSQDGRNLLYATYLGGFGVDVPHSLVCDSLNNLIILGSTASPDFPSTSGSFKGGPIAHPFNFQQYLQYTRGADMFLAKLNPTGTQLMASRFIGGNNSDGMLNHTAQVLYNYGDQFRGEVVCDRFNNIYIASNSRSAAVSTAGSYQPDNAGGYDALIGKFNPDLSTVWITNLGGQNDDAAYSLRCLSSGKVVVCGGSTSGNFPTTAGAFMPVIASPFTPANENQINGWISILSPDGGQLMHSTFISSRWYDQTYFVEEKRGESIYVFGQTKGDLYKRPGSFGSATGGMFVFRFDSTLSRLEDAVRFGRRPNSPELSPTAMTVDSCGQVYMAGWGSLLNLAWPTTSLTTNGLPVTADAQQGATDGNDFYFIVLNSDFSSQKYGTFFGGRGAAEHVDGGTSRFDKNGIIYQAVCADCGGTDVFPTSPGAFSNSNQSSNCNLGLIKFEFSPLATPLQLLVGPDSLCPGQPIQIRHNATNNSNYALTALPWNEPILFGNPAQYLPPVDSGIVTIRLVGNGPGCSIREVLERSVKVLKKPYVNDTLVSFCPGDTIQLGYPSQYQYQWTPTDGLESDTNPTQTLTDGLEHLYHIVARHRLTGCTDTVNARIRNSQGTVNIKYVDKTPLCALERTIVLRTDTSFRPNRWMVNGTKYEDLDSILVSYLNDTLFASVRSLAGCPLFDSIPVVIPLRRPSFDTTVSVFLKGEDCSNLERSIRANGRPDSAFWVANGSQIGGQQLTVGPKASILTYVQMTAGCLDTSLIEVLEVSIMIPNILTPDEDGVNDKILTDGLEFETFTVYNRWGKQVYVQNAPLGLKGPFPLEWKPEKRTPAGTYFYKIKLRDSSVCKGWIELAK